MLYKDLEIYFEENKYKSFIKNSLSHIINLNIQPQLNEDLFLLANQFRYNKELELYIKLNDFFEEKKSEFPFSIQIRTLLLISASNNILIENYLSINKSFFIIHSVADYGLKCMDNKIEHGDFLHPCLPLLNLFIAGYIPPKIAIYIFEHLTFTINYARKYSTDYDFIYGILLNIVAVPSYQEDIKTEALTQEEIESLPKQIDFLKKHAENDIYCIHFIIQLLEWSYDNINAGQDEYFKKIFYILNEIQELTPSLNFDKEIELCLMRYREQFNNEYDYLDCI